MHKNLHIEAFNTVNKMGLFLFSMLLRLLKLGKLAEYFSPFYPKVCHYPIITFSSEHARLLGSSEYIHTR